MTDEVAQELMRAIEAWTGSIERVQEKNEAMAQEFKTDTDELSQNIEDLSAQLAQLSADIRDNSSFTL